MIRPIDAYPGKVATPTAEYPDGKAQNITSPGDGTGTPWEAKLVNDLFGFQQYLAAKAGITPSGTPDNATASQQFDALWKLLNARPLTFNLTADANYTLTADQNLIGNLTITDTGVVLTAARDIIVDTVGRLFLFTNSTAQTLTVRTLAGTGIAVAAGASAALICDETDVLDFGDFSSAGRDVASTAEAQAGTDNEKVITPLRLHETMLGGVAQTWQDVSGSRSVGVTYTNTTGRPIEVRVKGSIINTAAGVRFYVDGLNVHDTYANTVTPSGTFTAGAVVPNGSTYMAQLWSTSTLAGWFELR